MRSLDNLMAQFVALQSTNETVQQYCGTADKLYNSGQYDQALPWYHRAIQADPKLFQVYNLIGNIYKYQGHHDEARKCYEHAISLNPQFAVAWSNYAGILKEQGKLKEALTMYQYAIVLAPGFADAYSNMGNVLKDLGRYAEAVKAYQIASQINPTFATPHNNLATVYHDCGYLDMAIQHYRIAIQCDSSFPDAFHNLANALKAQGKLDESIAAYQTALKLSPNSTHVLNNLGNALKERGRAMEAYQCYESALKIHPLFPAALNNIASMLKEFGRPLEAIERYKLAIQADPGFVDAYSNLGNAYKELNRVEDAIACYKIAIARRPTFADAHTNLASTYKDSGRMQEAIAEYRIALQLRPDGVDAYANLLHCLQTTCMWTDRDLLYSRLAQIVEAQLRVGQTPCVQPFHAIVYPFTLQLALDLARAYARRVAASVHPPAMPFPGPPRVRVPRPPPVDKSLLTLRRLPPPTGRQQAADGTVLPDARLHIGYVSSDFGDHPLSHLMQSVFGMHDRRHFRVTCYALSANDGTHWRQKIETEAEHFVDLTGLTNEQAAQHIASQGVHILVNLNGYTKGARNEIFALRPAPLQMLVLGYPSTTGAEWMDYFVTDPSVTPPELGCAFSERLIRMPHTYFIPDHRQVFGRMFDAWPEGAREDVAGEADPQAYKTRQGTGFPPHVLTRTAYGLPENRVVLCNFNQLYKTEPATVDMWSAILHRAPHAVLWLLRFPPDAEANMRKEVCPRAALQPQLKRERCSVCWSVVLCYATRGRKGGQTAQLGSAVMHGRRQTGFGVPPSGTRNDAGRQTNGCGRRPGIQATADRGSRRWQTGLADRLWRMSGFHGAPRGVKWSGLTLRDKRQRLPLNHEPHRPGPWQTPHIPGQAHIGSASIIGHSQLCFPSHTPSGLSFTLHMPSAAALSSRGLSVKLKRPSAVGALLEGVD
eukprot:gnl/Trimastix_PCT/607.p1 GENE.gnl/Trimastix_PCT/607~~gnl/Trimastix_PCT/607.p1  ORF type:complete len:937 (+),score=199.44 gnl/Trimastix_PCT/607:34-2844(+)